MAFTTCIAWRPFNAKNESTYPPINTYLILLVQDKKSKKKYIDTGKVTRIYGSAGPIDFLLIDNIPYMLSWIDKHDTILEAWATENDCYECSEEDSYERTE